MSTGQKDPEGHVGWHRTRGVPEQGEEGRKDADEEIRGRDLVVVESKGMLRGRSLQARASGRKESAGLACDTDSIPKISQGSSSPTRNDAYKKMWR